MRFRALSRRAFVRGLLGGLVAATGVARSAGAAGSLLDAAGWDAAGGLAGLVPDRRSARAVARAAGLPHGSTRAPALARGLLERLDAAPSAGRAKLAEALRRRIRRDFEEEAMLRADGWYLSRTEAELAALAASLR